MTRKTHHIAVVAVAVALTVWLYPSETCAERCARTCEGRVECVKTCVKQCPRDE